MAYWQLLIITGVVFIIIEIFTPVMFFLNLALACFLTAIVALFVFDWNILVPVFVVLSMAFLIFLRPILVKKRNHEEKTGVEEKYIGKIAKVIEPVTSTSGGISIYDERWNARCETGEEFSVGSEVRIVKNDSLILYVESVNKK